MKDDEKPLDPLRQSHEDEYFHRKNQALISEMRQRLGRREHVESLRAESGVGDEGLLESLADLGLTRETLPVLHLVPLIQVAWADGEIQPDERELLVEAAADAGVTAGSPAWAAFEGLLSAPPAPALYDAALDYIRLVLAALPEDEAADARGNLQKLAKSVARASGGLFGIFGKVDGDERDALDRIAEKLSARGGGVVGKV